MRIDPVKIAVFWTFSVLVGCAGMSYFRAQAAEPAAKTPDSLPQGAVARMAMKRSRPSDGGTAKIAFSPDGKILAAGTGDDVRLWEAATGKEIRVCEGHLDKVLSVAFSPDGMTLASGSNDNTIRLWETATGKEIRVCEGHDGLVGSVVFSPDGKTLASTGQDATIRLWEAATGKALHVARGHQIVVLSLAYSPDGNTLASGSADQDVHLWDVPSGKVQVCTAHQGTVTSVAFSPDGKTLASSSGDGTIRLWDAASGKENLLFSHLSQGKPVFVFSVAFSPDGKILASGSADKMIRLWEAASGKEVRVFKGHEKSINSVAFAPDGNTLASAGEDAVLVWDVYGPSAAGQALSPKELDALWTDLAGEDGPKAFLAIGTMRTAPKQAVPFLKERLRSASPADSRRLTCLIDELDSDQFSVREKASQALEQLGAAAGPALKEKLASAPKSLELRRRLEKLLEKLNQPGSKQLRDIRALQVLESAAGGATPEAREVIKTLAQGLESDRLTQEAKASLQRLAKRQGEKAAP